MKDQQVYKRVHHRIKRQAQPKHKQHESNWILMLAKKDYNDLVSDIPHKSIHKSQSMKFFVLFCFTGSSICAKQGVQNQYSDGDDESDDLSSKVSAL